MDKNMQAAMEALRVSAKKPGLATDPAFQAKQRATVVRRLLIATGGAR